jgi:vesicle-associated membrane protein 4
MASIPSSAPMSASRLQAQVDNTIHIIRENIKKVSEQGENLDSLHSKTNNLAISSNGFRRNANKVNKQMCSKHVKSRICLVGGVFFLLLVLVVIPIVALMLHH